VTLTFDFWLNAYRATAIEYTWTKFGVDSSSRFLLECGQTDEAEPAAIQAAWLLGNLSLNCSRVWYVLKVSHTITISTSQDYFSARSPCSRSCTDSSSRPRCLSGQHNVISEVTMSTGSWARASASFGKFTTFDDRCHVRHWRCSSPVSSCRNWTIVTSHSPACHAAI